MGYGATFGILGGGMASLPPPPKSAYGTGKVRRSETNVLPLRHATNRGVAGLRLRASDVGTARTTGKYNPPLQAMLRTACGSIKIKKIYI